MNCFFVSDLHGHVDRYRKLFHACEEEKPDALFFGGDLLPHPFKNWWDGQGEKNDFILDFLAPEVRELNLRLGAKKPRIFLILGNDDARSEEQAIEEAAADTHWEYLHDRKAALDDFTVYGYAYVPPTPFLFKDWERYDVSRFVDVGCVSPEEGQRSVPVNERRIRYESIARDLKELAGGEDLSKAIFLFHSPPYDTALDRAALDGKKIDHAPLDVHVGSIAIRKFIKMRQPRVTLHGHVHESASITEEWREQMGNTWAFSAAHHGPELALVRFDPEDPAAATRDLI